MPTDYRMIIAGNRDCKNRRLINKALKASPWRKKDIEHIIVGDAKGVDINARRYAVEHEIDFTVFRADWSKHGAAAGPIRNREMADTADILLAIWNGKSPGTRNMIETAIRRSTPVFIFPWIKD